MEQTHERTLYVGHLIMKGFWLVNNTYTGICSHRVWIWKVNYR